MERRAAGRTQARACATLILLACCPCASALNPSLDINQYAHTAWMIGDGFFNGGITAIAQTPDGYLWLATESGLLRFDGVRTAPWRPPAGEHLPGTIRSLLGARDGRLWIGAAEGLASWKDGKLTHYPELAGQQVRPLLEDREGTVWAGGYLASTGRLCAIGSSGAHCYGEDGRFGREVLSLYEDSRGYLWAGAVNGLWKWNPGPPKLYPMPDPISAMEGVGDTLLLSMRGTGIRQLVEGNAEAYPLPGSQQLYRPIRLFRDRNGGLWIGTVDQGLLHVHEGITDQYARSDGLSGDFVQSFFEDREGNLWVVTADGLDRFTDFAIPTVSVKQGLSNSIVSAILAAKDGSVWLGTNDGLNRWKDGRITIYRKRTSRLPDDFVQAAFEDYRGRIWVATRSGVAWFENGRFTPITGVPPGQILSIDGDRLGNLWVNQDHELLHLRGAAVVERIPWSQLGREEPRALLVDEMQGGLWLGFFRGGVAYLKDGRIGASYTSADGLGEGRVTGLQLDRDDALWAATEGGLSRVKNGQITTLTSKNGLPCDRVRGVLQDYDRSLWLYMACGLVRIARPELDGWLTDSKRTIQTTVFDNSDGVRSHLLPVGNFNPRFAQSADGKLWFARSDGVSVIDPRHIPFNKLPPPVRIEQITADRKTFDTTSSQRLPPLVRDLEIDYTALSLAAPEKNRFRVKLEGYDPDWRDAGNDRRAFYTNLPPRNYRFRVAGCNNSGVWNEAGASLDFSIAPAYYQTEWFLASCVAAFLLLLWALYRYRLHRIAQEFNARLDERVNERTRIARELHDTLLQGFQGVIFRFQAARNMLPRRAEEAIDALDGALERAEQALAEGRDAIHDLRSSTEVTNELAQAVTALGNEMSHELASQGSAKDSAKFRVVVEGPPRELHPILRDDVYAIAREAVRNAFRHAQAHDIEAQITYNGSSFQLRIRDDGKGIDPAIVAAGRTGHYGVPGMRERARRIGGKLEVWTATGAGTEIELTIPGSIAYTASPGRSVLGRFRKTVAHS